MATPRHYDEDFRSIGQALEAKDISVFEIKWLTGMYVIHGTPEQTGSLRSKARRWLRVVHGSSTDPLILRLTDVERLSEAGRAKRSRPGQLTDFRALSNILRTIGTYLDSNEFELIELQKRPISITLSYRNRAGNERIEDRTVSSFYRLFLELCGKRA
jgi:hypothetical protein